MSEQAMEQTDDDGFTYEVCDEALEAVAEVGVERGPTNAPNPPTYTVYCMTPPNR